MAEVNSSSRCTLGVSNTWPAAQNRPTRGFNTARLMNFESDPLHVRDNLSYNVSLNMKYFLIFAWEQRGKNFYCFIVFTNNYVMIVLVCLYREFDTPDVHNPVNTLTTVAKESTTFCPSTSISKVLRSYLALKHFHFKLYASIISWNSFKHLFTNKDITKTLLTKSVIPDH